MEKVFSKELVKYAVLSFTLSLGVTIVTYLLPLLIAGPSPWWLRTETVSTIYQTIASSLLILAIMMGFLVPRQLYHYFVKEVIGDMNQKLNKTLQPEKTAKTKTLNFFALVAGGSPFYQVVCMIFACSLFIALRLTGGLDIRPILTDWVGLLLCALMGGIVGPMATTISAFAIYCGVTFGDGDFFDPIAKDRRGGFRSLGTLGVRSSFMAAITPGVAIPVLFLSSKLKTTYDLAINIGLLFFLMICVASFFFVPTYYVHKAMKTSRKKQIQRFEDLYRTKFDQFMAIVSNGKPAKTTETSSMLALKEMCQGIVGASDWPTDYLAILRVTINIALPILSYVLKLLING
jgi:hypothetical protein